MENWVGTVEDWLPESEFCRRVVGTALGRTISVAVIALLGVLSYIAWEPISAMAVYIGSLLGTSVAAPLWLMLILGLSGLAWIGFPIYRYAQGEEPEERTLHEREFTEDEIRGIPWTWSWIDGNPTNLKPLCPMCEMEVDLKDSQSFKVEDMDIAEVARSGTAYTVGSSSYRDWNTDRTIALCPDHGQVKEWKQKKQGRVIDLAKREIKRLVRTGEWQ